ncbi:MAG: glycosyltransferase family 4 protein [Planctomycetes bacterium]|nr:glycosyltransferase family 4 protein [Planctomycetota bacterium]
MPRRLTLVIHSLNGGGAERTLAAMASRWAQMGYAVTLITLDTAKNDRYPVAADVHRVGLDLLSESRNKLEGLWSNVSRVRQLRRAILESRGDQVISFTEKMNILTLLACPRNRVVVCERVDPRHHPIGRLWELLRRCVYPRCAALVVQTEAVRDYMHRVVKRRPIHVIPNSIVPTDSSSHAERSIVAIGRLVPQKGFDLLVKAFSSVTKRHPAWRLNIYGEGPDRPSLEALILDLTLNDVVNLSGWTTEPLQAISSSKIFVLSSRYEGFPNALLEAMAAGLAVVSFDCESGPREIIRDEVDGLLVPAQDVAKLSAALDRLMSNDEDRCRIASRAPEVCERFSETKFFDAWERVFDAQTNPEQG